MSKTKNKLKKSIILPAPVYSDYLYLNIAPKDIALFKFILEAQDNLAYFTVLDKWQAILKIIFSPHQRQEIIDFLLGLQETLQIELLLDKIITILESKQKAS